MSNLMLKSATLLQLYLLAVERAQKGERTVWIDEMTGIQAIERKEKDLPLRPGKVQRREFEYIRHGTPTLIASFDVVTGWLTDKTLRQEVRS